MKKFTWTLKVKFPMEGVPRTRCERNFTGECNVDGNDDLSVFLLAQAALVAIDRNERFPESATIEFRGRIKKS